MEKQPDVRHDAGGLGRSAIRELGDHRRVDVDAHYRTHEGSMLPTPMLCSIDDSITTMVHARKCRRVAVLRLDQIHDRLRQRTVVSDRSGEQ